MLVAEKHKNQFSVLLFQDPDGSFTVLFSSPTGLNQSRNMLRSDAESLYETFVRLIGISDETSEIQIIPKS